jgi:hypothetical protein
MISRLRWSSVTIVVAIVCALLDCGTALAGLSISTDARGRLNDDPDHTFVVTVATKHGQEKAVVQSLHIKESQTFPEFGVVFVKATGNEILGWPDIDDIEFVDVLDDVEATVVYHLVAQLHRIEFYDNLGVFRPGVLNLSIGPPRKLIGKDASGERTVRRVLQDVIERHGIPVVMSVGNDGPEPGLSNGWATQGVLLATAMNAAGTELWSRASRFVAPMPKDFTMFGAQGIDTIGPRADCSPKSKEEIEAEERMHLADVVGRENLPCFDLASGTSFAAALLSRHVCLIHQAMGILALKLSHSSSTAADVELEVPPFIRAYIDNTFDRDHPYFRNRLADTQKHFDPLQTKISSAERQDAWDMLVGTVANISIHYDPRSVRAFLVHASTPVTGLSREQIGEGFLSLAAIRHMLLQLHYADLVEIIGEGAPQRMTWVSRIKETKNPQVFTEQQVRDIEQYCTNHDLILGLPLLSQP